MLVIFAGLPGAGKTTLAKELARRVNATYLRVDSIEQAMANSNLNVNRDEGYMVGHAVAEDNLRIGGTVVADSVNPIELTRTDWLNVAERAGRKGIQVEVVCSDPFEHRRRVETRATDISGLRLPSWQDVLDREYHPWSQDRIIIDTAGKSVEQCVDELVTRLPSLQPEGMD